MKFILRIFTNFSIRKVMQRVLNIKLKLRKSMTFFLNIMVIVRP